MKVIKNFITKHQITLSSFLLVGLTTAFIYFSAFTVCWKFFKINYTLSVSIGYFLGLLFHFNANRIFTFKSHQHSIIQQLSKYFLMIIFNYVITVIIVRLTVEYFKFSPYVGIIFSIGVTVNFGYLISRYWVFSNR